jgi:hypothetical protein
MNEKDRDIENVGTGEAGDIHIYCGKPDRKFYGSRLSQDHRPLQQNGEQDHNIKNTQ